MSLYVGKQFEVSKVSNEVVSVQCDKCSCEYFYELARIGTGMANSHYGIGSAAAELRAAAKSQKDLEQRLELESELVPCPSCHWINDELVEGYRRGKFRSSGWVAFSIGLAGTLLSLVCAWFCSLGPARDRGALPYFLFAGPAISAVLGLAVFLIAKAIRKSIRPNRNFPMLPRLPAGTPTALIINEAGEIEEVGQTQEANFESKTIEDWQTFQIGLHQLPTECCLCLDGASPKHGIELVVETSLKLDVPRCVACAKKSRLKFFVIWLFVSLISILATSVLCLILGLKAETFWLVFGGLSVVGLALGSFIASAMTWSAKMRVKDSSRGILALRFRNHEYAARFKP